MNESLEQHSKWPVLQAEELRGVVAELETENAQLKARAEAAEDEIQKLDEEVQCAMGASGILFHLMRGLGLDCEDIEPHKWHNVRAEKAEARLAILDARRALKAMTKVAQMQHISLQHVSTYELDICEGAEISSGVMAAIAAYDALAGGKP